MISHYTGAAARPAHSFRRLRLTMKLAAAHQPAGDVSRLQECALSRPMGSQVPRDRNQDMPALVAVAPLAKLPRACLEHLVGMKARILAQERTRERRDQRLGRVT